MRPNNGRSCTPKVSSATLSRFRRVWAELASSPRAETASTPPMLCAARIARCEGSCDSQWCSRPAISGTARSA